MIPIRFEHSLAINHHFNISSSQILSIGKQWAKFLSAFMHFVLEMYFCHPVQQLFESLI